MPTGQEGIPHHPAELAQHRDLHGAQPSTAGLTMPAWAGRLAGMRLAYADPPYPGQAKRHYADQVLCQEVNHEVLIGTLCEHYDGWALSTSSRDLRRLLPLCPEGVRVAAWVKPFAAWKKGVVPPYAWEPVLFVQPPRKRLLSGYETFGKAADWHSASPPIFLREDRGIKGIKGTKPFSFCMWILDLLGFQLGDTLEDLFPGSGIMSEAVALYGRQRELWPSAAP